MILSDKKEEKWNRCIYCGKFFSYDDIDTNKLLGSYNHRYDWYNEQMIEEHDFRHVQCEHKELERRKKLNENVYG